MSYLEDSNFRGEYLEFVFRYWKTIHPTGVEIERVFTAAILREFDHD